MNNAAVAISGRCRCRPRGTPTPPHRLLVVITGDRTPSQSPGRRRNLSTPSKGTAGGGGCGGGVVSITAPPSSRRLLTTTLPDGSHGRRWHRHRHNRRFYPPHYGHHRLHSSAPTPSASPNDVDGNVPSSDFDGRYVDADPLHAPPDFDPSSAVVYPSFLSSEEGESLAADVDRRIKRGRRRYESGHWDDVIRGYREVELYHPDDFNLVSDTEEEEGGQRRGVPAMDDEAMVSEVSAGAIRRVRRHLEARHLDVVDVDPRWLPCHAIDLRADGQLTAHVDSVKFSGDLVAGLSLLSSAVMRLRPSESEEAGADGGEDEEGRSGTGGEGGLEGEERRRRYVDLYLPPLSLYVLSGVARYRYTHELLPGGATFLLRGGGGGGAGRDDGRGAEMEDEEDDGEETTIVVQRERRVSVIFRDAKKE